MQDSSLWYGATHVGGGGSLERMWKEWMEVLSECVLLARTLRPQTHGNYLPVSSSGVCVRMLTSRAKASNCSLLLPQGRNQRLLPTETPPAPKGANLPPYAEHNKCTQFPGHRLVGTTPAGSARTTQSQLFWVSSLPSSLCHPSHVAHPHSGWVFLHQVNLSETCSQTECVFMVILIRSS